MVVPLRCACDARGSDYNANKLRFDNHNARALGDDHRATMALARATVTMAKADLWRASVERSDFLAGAEDRTVSSSQAAIMNLPRRRAGAFLVLNRLA